VLDELNKLAQAVKLKKVTKKLRLLRDVGPGHPGLKSHRYQSLTGPVGEEVWESCGENKAPGAWRLWWVYGPGADTLMIVTVGPHR
jgi:hypothetical protein